MTERERRTPAVPARSDGEPAGDRARPRWAFASRLWRDLRHRRHAMRLRPVQDVAAAPGGGFTGTGPYPVLELISARAAPPTSWCWLDVAVRAGAGDLVPVLTAWTAPDAAPTVVDLPRMRAGRTQVLLLLPDGTRRLTFAPGTDPGAIPMARIAVVEVGRLRLFARLLALHPREVWTLWRAHRSLDELKVALIRREERRSWPDLDTWVRHYRRDPAPEPAGDPGLVSVVLSSGGGRAQMDGAVRSVTGQSHASWELLVLADAPDGPDGTADARIRWLGADASPGRALAAATGDLVVMMDDEDRLAPSALARFGAAARHGGGEVIYADALAVGPTGGALRLRARSAFSHDRLLSGHDVPRPWALRAPLARRIARRAPSASEDLDLLLRAVAEAGAVTHIPDILLDRPADAARATAPSRRAALKAAHLQRLGFPSARVVPRPGAGGDAVTFHAAPAGRILAVIPTRDRCALLRRCVETVLATTKGLAIDIVVVDHQSTEPAILAYFAELRARRAATVLPHEGPFNYSAINNGAVRRALDGHDFILFLNNDMEARDAGWLDAMVDLAMRADVGAVGATLLYPDGRVQHAGVVIGMRGHAEHAYKFEDFAALTAAGAVRTGDVSAVTGACMLVQAPAFLALGGFDERLAVGFNDVDLCLRLRGDGLRVLHCADAVLLHHESASRGHAVGDPHPADSRLFAARYRTLLDGGDPFFSPLLDRDDYAFLPARGARAPSPGQPGCRTVEHVRPVPRPDATAGSERPGAASQARSA